MSGPDRHRILVVDDEPAAQRVLARILQNKGYETASAPDVPSALGLLEEDGFALVMTDLDMPGRSGLELIEALGPRRPEIATVLVTGRGSTDVASTALAAGAYGYMSKPFHPDEVEITVLNALRRRELELESLGQQQRLETMVRERTTELMESLADLQSAQDELRRQADQLRDLDRMKAQFIQIVSHELRTPLTVIRGGL
ncbi:MAG TPA: response regulator, partial [Rubrobacteraceae bacterium]|nr:response regulator [Rubrobacteraceae bacterium]